MAEYIDRYDAFASYLCGQGYLVAGEDFLGHGQTALSERDLGYFAGQDPATVLVRDVHRLKKTVQALWPGIPVYIIGHSMGSFVVRNYLCRYGTGIGGAVVMSTGMQPLALLRLSKLIAGLQGALMGERHKSGLINFLAFGSYTKKIPKARTPMDWLSVSEANVDRYNEDPLCGFTFTVNGFKTLFELIYRLHDRKNLEKMPKDLPVLFVAGDADPVGDYGKAVESVYRTFREELGMRDVELHMFAGDRHELLQEDDKEDVYRVIGTWIAERTARSTAGGAAGRLRREGNR